MLLLMLPGTGCNKNATPPPPLTVEQLPAAFDKAFAKAAPELKGMASEVISMVQSKDYAKGYSTLQTLGSAPNLSKEQSSVVGRGMLTLSGLMQSAASQGDEKAAEAVKNYRSNK